MSDANTKLLPVFLRPLSFLEIDEPFQANFGSATQESVLKFACTPGIDFGLDALVKRYSEIKEKKPQILAAPYEERILDKLIWPLRHAKAGYMFGNYLGTIALCGLVAEMITMFLFELYASALTIDSDGNLLDAPISQESFEEMKQSRRIRTLWKNGLPETTRNRLDLIRDVRNRYLHIWSRDHKRLPEDAKKLYQAALDLVYEVIGQGFSSNGEFVMNQAVVDYLERKSKCDQEMN